MVRRNDLDICADLLKVSRDGALKTHMVYKANLNFSIIKKYIKRLVENGLLESENGRYYTTDKGAQYLDQYREFFRSMPGLRG